MSRTSITTTISQAVDYWSKYVDECELSVDWAEADTHCWRCGCQKNLQRCHIIPDSLGGKDTASNIVLLCKRCHADGPNVNDPEIMWDWIRAYSVPFYETFWVIQAQEEYKRIYKKSFDEEIMFIMEKANITNFTEIKQIYESNLRNLYRQASNHFGQPYFNTATIAGLYRMLVKQLAKEYNVALD